VIARSLSPGIAILIPTVRNNAYVPKSRQKTLCCRNNVEDRHLGNLKFRVLIEQDEDGVFVAEVPTFPGCIAQGTTRKEALKNAQDATELYIESLQSRGEPIPPPITEEIVGIEIRNREE